MGEKFHRHEYPDESPKFRVHGDLVIEHYTHCLEGPEPQVIKHFSCSTQLRLKFILLIYVRMPTIVHILTFISRKNYSWWFKYEISIIWAIFIFMSSLNFMLSRVEHGKSFVTLRPGFDFYWHDIVSLSKTHQLNTVLDNTQEVVALS